MSINEQQAIPLFVTWKDGDNESMKEALSVASKSYASINANYPQRSVASTTFRNIDTPNISVRDGFNRNDYDYFRPGERLPTEVRAVQSACAMAYKRFGIIRNMIDMMTDFVTKGISIVHPSAKVQKFGREWFKKSNGKAVSGKIVRRLLREGSAPVRRKIQKIDDSTLNSLKEYSTAAKSPLKPGEIPLGYRVLNPIQLEAISGELSQFISDDSMEFGIKVPYTLINKIKTPKTPAERELVSSLRPDIIKSVLGGESVVPLAKNRLVMLHYKKDDDEIWPTPLLYSILDDLQMLQKLKMADRAALDGAISHIRLWKLGDLQNKIVPTPEGIQTLADILLRSTGGGCVDLVWGPDLQLIETGTEMYKFLTPEKYASTMSSIFQGLGIPPILTGASGDVGMTNNFVSLRVLLERLDYCREVLTDFWYNELEIVRSVFNFRQPFSLSYAVPTLSDDSAEKKLCIELIDRDIVSGVFVQERFGADPEIEEARIKQDYRKRDVGKLPPKASQFHIDSQQKPFLERTFATSGEHTPSEFGVELKPKKRGEVPPNEKSADRTKQLAEVKAKQPPKTNGRPIGRKDGTKRKQGRQSPKQSSSASLANAVTWANAAYQKIDEVLKEPTLKLKSKKTLRSMTDQEFNTYENVKFAILCGHEIYSDVTEASIKAGLKNISVPEQIKDLVDEANTKYIADTGKSLEVEQARQIKILSYAMFNFDDEDGGV